jgi:hypothetical protein
MELCDFIDYSTLKILFSQSLSTLPRVGDGVVYTNMDGDKHLYEVHTVTMHATQLDDNKDHPVAMIYWAIYVKHKS